MAKQNKKEHIPRPKEDVKIENNEPKFKEVLKQIVKKNTDIQKK